MHRASFKESRIVVRSRAFENFLESYVQGLLGNGKDDDDDDDPCCPFRLPRVLRDACSVLLLHDKKLPVAFEALPDDTLYASDDPEETERRLRERARQNFGAHFFKLDDVSRRHLRNERFRSLVLATFHFEGIWDAVSAGTRCFDNRDGTRAIVDFVTLGGATVQVRNGNARAVLVPLSPEGYTVCFETTVGSRYPEGTYRYARLEIPDLDISLRRVDSTDDRDGNAIVVRFGYEHFKDGNAVRTDACTGRETRFVLDRPFRMSVLRNREELLSVRVERIEGRKPLSSREFSWDDDEFLRRTEKHSDKPLRRIPRVVNFENLYEPHRRLPCDVRFENRKRTGSCSWYHPSSAEKERRDFFFE